MFHIKSKPIKEQTFYANNVCLSLPWFKNYTARIHASNAKTASWCRRVRNTCEIYNKLPQEVKA